MTQHESVGNWYRERVGWCTRRLERRHRQDVWLTRARLATFLPAVGLAYWGVFQAAAGGPWLVAAAVLAVCFIVVVNIHQRVLHDADELRARLSINETQLARLDRRWDLVPECPVEVPPEGECVANDLDLFGHASLFQFVSQAHTPLGRATLAQWLLTPAAVPVIFDRQQAVTHLAPAADVREEIALRGRLLGAREQGTWGFVDWAEAKPLLGRRPWLVWLARTTSAAMVLAVAAGMARLVPAEAAFLAVAAIACVHLVLFAVYGGRIHEVLDRVASRSHDIRQYRPLFDSIAALPTDVRLFAQLHAHMGRTPREPLAVLAGLMRLVRLANLRRDGLFGVPYYVSELFLATDFHVLALMERWQRRHGPLVRRWLEAVGRTEATVSLATLVHDHPDWVLPVFESAPADTIVAKQLGHPLIADDACVRNDIEVGPAGTLVLVTGSNMSGKSTLLRAVGLNVTLAQAGGSVCARELRLPPVELATSIRARDSLADGVSFFLAELRRLKQVVDQSREAQQHAERTLLYLLDEVLQGTNSAERHIAVSRVVGHLVDHGSIGMVSTHDLELAQSPELTAACHPVHFRESFTERDGKEQMTFDYVLRPGVAPTTNALKLLKLVGLDD